VSASSAAPRFLLDGGLGSTTRLNSGHAMPVLGLGVFQSPPGRPTHDAVQYALQIGCRSFDTASVYRNEKDVGAAIRASKIPRDQVFVTTKLWNDDQGFDSTLRAFERSRRALDLEYVDLYLIHWPVPNKRKESWRAMERLVSEGKCRSIGVSNFTTAHLTELAESSTIPPAVDQVEFSPFLYQRKLLEHCQAQGTQLEAYAPLTKGERLVHPTVVRTANAHGATAAQVMIRWGLQHHVVEIPKSTRPERIRENAGVFGFELTPAEMKALDALDEGYRTSWDPTPIP
jgi:methylglyoxal/glyoxal reductase